MQLPCSLNEKLAMSNHVGSSDYLKTERKGAVNYLTAINHWFYLKTVIYATALQRV